MKYIIVILFTCIAVSALAQKEFEGMIRYEASSPDTRYGKTKITEEIKMFFTPGKILLRSNRHNELEDILILLDSAQSITINPQNKTYDVKKLRERKPEPVATEEIIAGYNATPVQTGSSPWSFGIPVNATMWFGDSLYFRVPATLDGNDELMMVHNNHIMLKAVIRMDDYGYSEEGAHSTGSEMRDNQATLIAVEIVPGTQPASMFTIPNDFTKLVNDVYSPQADSVMVLVDTGVIAPAEIEPPPARKTPAKAPVKKSTTNKAPIKKED